MGERRWSRLGLAALVLLGCARRDEPAGEVCPDSQPRHPRLQDPLRFLVTLNAHGVYSAETFSLPADVYVLVPHPMGLEAPYELLSPPNRLTFEEMLYVQPSGLIPRPSSGGWHLYRPNEIIRNVNFSPWSRSSDPTKEYSAWIRDVPVEDRAYVAPDAHGAIPAFAVVPARDSSKKTLKYKDVSKLKIKVFAPTNLRAVLQQLRAQAPTAPIVLAPFSCNEKANTRNLVISLDSSTSVAFPE